MSLPALMSRLNRSLVVPVMVIGCAVAKSEVPKKTNAAPALVPTVPLNGAVTATSPTPSLLRSPANATPAPKPPPLIGLLMIWCGEVMSVLASIPSVIMATAPTFEL